MRDLSCSQKWLQTVPPGTQPVYHEKCVSAAPKRHSSGARRLCQSKASPSGCGREEIFKASPMARSCSALIVSRGKETNSAVPLCANKFNHWEFFAQGTESAEVWPAQSASTMKKVPFWGARNARQFTPICRVRFQSVPLVSSPIRCNSKIPAARWPIVLHPMIRVRSPAASRIS